MTQIQKELRASTVGEPPLKSIEEKFDECLTMKKSFNKFTPIEMQSVDGKERYRIGD